MRYLALISTVLLAACASAPPAPEWAKLSTQSVNQATAAALQGQDRLAQHHWSAAWSQARRTASPEPMARVALIRCAVVQATTLQTSCPDFDALRALAPEADQAYARYLLGMASASDVALLPPAHRAVATAILNSTEPSALATTLRNTPDPLSRLIAASAVFQQLPSLQVVGVAVDTASEQGWQRPLLTWLTLQQRLAQEAGQLDLAAQAQQRLQWLTEAALTRPPPN